MLGLHVDYHLGPHDTEMASGADPDELERHLRAMDVDFVQIDSKGGHGFTSYRATIPEATMCPGLQGDLVRAWRIATRRLGLPLHAHWIAMSDELVIARHPDWRLIDSAGQPVADRICWRSPYAERYMIPQLLDLIGSWELDGVWIDAEAWCLQACYCHRCTAAWAAAGHADAPPTAPEQPAWPAWMEFQRRSFDEHVNHYADAVHARFPACRVCDNWSLTLSQPGEPRLRVDFISSDDAAVAGYENMQVEARFTSTRGLPWDFMQWLFFGSRGMHVKDCPQSLRPLDMLKQEAALILALGGSHQIYEQPARRDGALVPWRVARIAELHRWMRLRQELCQGAEPWEDVAVVVSEHHFAKHATGRNLLWSYDFGAVRGAVRAASCNHRGVDVVDEWSLLPRLERFGLLIVPEQEDVSAELIARAQAWVRDGGALLVSGAGAPERWGAEFLGVIPGDASGPGSRHVAGVQGRVPLWSKTWRSVIVDGATAVSRQSRTDDPAQGVDDQPAATVHRVGRGAVAWLPCDAFAFHERGRYAIMREFLGGVLDAIGGRRQVRMTAPQAVEPILRRRGADRVIHLVNRGGGGATCVSDQTIEELPTVGPVAMAIELEQRPAAITTAWEGSRMHWTWQPGSAGAGTALIAIERIQIHEALVISA